MSCDDLRNRFNVSCLSFCQIYISVLIVKKCSGIKTDIETQVVYNKEAHVNDMGFFMVRLAAHASIKIIIP